LQGRNFVPDGEPRILFLGAGGPHARRVSPKRPVFKDFSSSFKVLSTRRESADDSISLFWPNFPVGIVRKQAQCIEVELPDAFSMGRTPAHF
jgi:hypothetical protein